MKKARDILGCVESFYEAVDSPDHWADAWSKVMRLFHAKTGCLYLEGRNGGGPTVNFLAMPGFDDASLALYGAHYVNVDPYALYGRRTGENSPFLSQTIILPENFRESEIWNDYSKKYVGAFHIIGGAGGVGLSESVRASVHRPEDASVFEIRDLCVYGLIMGHLIRAVNVKNQLEQEIIASNIKSSALDAMLSGVLVVDKKARTIFVNAQGERIAKAGSLMLGRIGGEVRLRHAGDTQRLHALIDHVAKGEAGGAMLSTVETDNPPIAVSVSRLPGRLSHDLPSSFAGSRSLVLLVIRDLQAGLSLDGAALTSLFGLSTTEAEVAMSLAAGHTIETLAEQRARSVATLRTQVRQILAKTGAKSIRHFIAMLGPLQFVR